MEKLFLLIFILINSVLINFGSLCLKKYANTYCNEDNEEDIKNTEKTLYYCGIGCCAILSFILLFFGPSSLIIFKFGPIFITGISLIFRLNKKQKIANIFCGIILIPIIVCIVLAGFIGLSQPFKPCEYEIDNNTLNELEIQQFNSKFTQYEGNNIRGSTVNTMLQAVIANNAAQDVVSRQVEVVFSNSLNIKPLSQNDITVNRVKIGEIFEVTCEISQDGEDKGLVYCILVTKKGDIKPQPIHTIE